MDESTIYQNCNTVALDFASNNFSVALNFFFKMVLSSKITYCTNHLGTSQPLTKEQSDRDMK